MREVSTASIRRPLVTGRRNRTVAAVLAVVAAVILPELVHAVGDASGAGNELAQAFLPMHLPVLLVGLLAGPVVGGVTGALAPLISFALSGLPEPGVLPYMVVELATYGLVTGWLAKRAMGVVWKVLLAQVAGRLVRLVAVVVAATSPGQIVALFAAGWDSALASWPGIVLQWCLIPLVMYWAAHARDRKPVSEAD